MEACVPNPDGCRECLEKLIWVGAPGWGGVEGRGEFRKEAQAKLKIKLRKNKEGKT